MIPVALEGRPSLVRMDCDDLSVLISVDGRDSARCGELLDQEVYLPAGRPISVIASKDGFKSEHQTIIPTTKHPTIVKFRQLERDRSREYVRREPFNPPWHLTPFQLDESWHLGIGFGLSGIADTWGLPLWAEYRLLNGLTVGFLYEVCAGPTYKGGGYGPYLKVHFNRNVYRGYFGYAESIQYSGEYLDLHSKDFLLRDLPWARAGFGYGLGYEIYPSQSGAQIGFGYRLGFREWGVNGQEFNANIWTGIRF